MKVSPVDIESHDGELLEGDGEVEGGDSEAGLDLVVAGEVAHHDHPAEHGHVLEHSGGELTTNTVEENVDSIGGGNVEGLVDVLGLVVEGPVQVEVCLDPGGFLTISSVSQDPEPQDSAVKITLGEEMTVSCETKQTTLNASQASPSPKHRKCCPAQTLSKSVQPKCLDSRDGIIDHRYIFFTVTGAGGYCKVFRGIFEQLLGKF